MEDELDYPEDDMDLMIDEELQVCTSVPTVI